MKYYHILTNLKCIKHIFIFDLADFAINSWIRLLLQLQFSRGAKKFQTKLCYNFIYIYLNKGSDVQVY